MVYTVSFSGTPRQPVSRLFWVFTLPMLLVLAALLCASPGNATPLGGEDAGLYREAFHAIANKEPGQALALAARANDQTLYPVVVGEALAVDRPRDNVRFDFNSYQRFLTQYPMWPESESSAIAQQGESALTGQEDPRLIVPFFDAHPPQTMNGMVAYANALQQSSSSQRVLAALRQQWQNSNFSAADQEVFLSHFGSVLEAADHLARLDRLLWDGSYSQAERLYPYLSPEWRALAMAWIALAKGDSQAQALLAAVPEALQHAPGLLTQQVHWCLKQDDIAGALAFIQQIPPGSPHAEAIWEVRQRLARHLLEQGDARNAYAVAANHGIADRSQARGEAEFLSGWIALRFLNDPAQAQEHFENLYQAAAAPISVARAAYWLARTAEASGQAQTAEGWDARAASFSYTYYGQLAATRLDSQNTLDTGLAPPQQGDFAANPFSTLVEQLLQVGNKKLGERFALAFAKNENSEDGLRRMAALAAQLDAPDIAVKIAKIAAKKKISLPNEGYPVLESAARQPNAALLHAIIRQESQFDPTVVSGSNAQGLMQLLPSTARHVLRTTSVRGDENLFNPENNIVLGGAYIQSLLDQFNGSLPLAIAAYNAGPNRVREWIGKMGDPREANGAMVDWIERIPLNETRNYVQRVLEALQIYRARLAGGTAVLLLKQDLGQ